MKKKRFLVFWMFVLMLLFAFPAHAETTNAWKVLQGAGWGKPPVNQKVGKYYFNFVNRTKLTFATSKTGKKTTIGTTGTSASKSYAITDGKTVYYVYENGKSIYQYNLAKKTKKRICSFPQVDEYGMSILPTNYNNCLYFFYYNFSGVREGLYGSHTIKIDLKTGKITDWNRGYSTEVCLLSGNISSNGRYFYGTPGWSDVLLSRIDLKTGKEKILKKVPNISFQKGVYANGYYYSVGHSGNTLYGYRIKEGSTTAKKLFSIKLKTIGEYHYELNGKYIEVMVAPSYSEPYEKYKCGITTGKVTKIS